MPQGRHAHLLLPAGLEGLTGLHPGILDDLTDAGAHLVPASEFRFYLAGGRLRLDDDGLRICGATRPLIEGVVRDRVRTLPGVDVVEDRVVAGVVTTPDRSRVTGVTLRSRNEAMTEETVGADLVVDTTGRGSRSPGWLADLGYTPPDEERTPSAIAFRPAVSRVRPPPLRPVAAGSRRATWSAGTRSAR